ncbi:MULTISPECIES: glycosyltransferase family 39 protein [unclassified Variovorax]|jgi:4-amino-4-deoxy-L-arabinose transferase-like glycosyltransferase|uniref:ArnT family glycosyltransferase n=1 Tax=unclassified Variovorax TaxID=663243 RepID=UPI000F7EB096|nr:MULTISPECIES: glycosyltransferase family 39 protein [unclassified Variovorax]RSZ45796.1 glycosyltransferase family 39 protein [Variovorax sp. 553]RSZ46750.1 glycosyltransferase family 39 protein [Variovorax sp. 679]
MKRPASAWWTSPQPLWLIFSLFAWLLATAWIRPLMAPDEGRYGGVALAMLRSGDWLVPRLDGLPFFHKPPLFYWIGAAAMAVTGPVEWAARLPSILGGGAAAAALFLFLRRWSTVRVALLSTVVLVTTPFFFLGAQFANLDMLVAGCISCTVLLAAGAALAREREEPWRALLAGAFLFAAAGLLAKGLIGLVLPAMVVVIWCGVTRRLAALRLALWLPGWAILLIVAGPWFVAMQMKYPEFFDYFVITQHFRRFASAGFNNEHGFWFYLPVLAGLTLPWFAWVFVPRGANDAARSRQPDIDWLMWIWLAVIVVFFSLPRSKLVGYVLPALPPLAYLIAQRVLAGRSLETLLPKVRAMTMAAAAVCIGCVIAVAIYASPPGTRLKLPAGQAVAPGDQVLMLDSYQYEIPFYWNLREPVLVSDDWKAAALDKRDNWRKEISDAARFDPARAARTLVDRTELADTLCVARTTWIVGSNTAQLANPWLFHAQLVAVNDGIAAWRFAGSPTGDPHCLDAPPPVQAPASAHTSGASGND